MDVKPKTTGFYREEAARLALDAARVPPATKPSEPAPIAAAPVAPVVPTPKAAPVIVLDEPQRPLLAPEPATNQNLRATRPEIAEPEPHQRIGLGKIVAWVLLAPWYVTMAAAAVGVDVLFVKDLLGL